MGMAYHSKKVLIEFKSGLGFVRCFGDCGVLFTRQYKTRTGPHGSIKLFNMDTLLYVGDFKVIGTQGRLYKSPVYRILSPNNCSFSSCGLNCSDEIIAGATEPYGEDVCLYLWDIRQLNAEKLLQTHMELYTDSHNRWLDLLFDVSKGGEDDALDSVLNTGSSVSQIGYFGSKSTDLYCLTHIETLQLWDTTEVLKTEGTQQIQCTCNKVAGPEFVGKKTADFTNPRKENGSGDPLDYLIDCMYHPIKDQLGRLHLFHIKDLAELKPVCPLMGGHTATVRCLQWDHKSETLLTGGEDSIISCWKSAKPQSSYTGKAVSGAMDKRKLHGSKPYEKPASDRTET
ncbi:WD repeat-containing protein 89 [Desmophyllum pertusum]|uniref:WD repeat-containing protein 89 n=1 Tax=Desmophyllum pertusum TaxID=174260 RepID=A0A9X0CM96_9CNID|nr:WD repeat-containing protein 89 [Desmophyllum pertusum]